MSFNKTSTNEAILLQLGPIIPRRWNIISDTEYVSASQNELAWNRISNNSIIQSFLTDHARFKLVHAGRRSYKTELCKRLLVQKAITNKDKHYFFGGPTFTQTKNLAWEDLKQMIPGFMITNVYESDLCIKLRNNTTIHLIGFDRPERFEGRIWDGGILDEFADMKDGTWEYHVEPALSDTKGWCIFIGTPNGLDNDMYRLYDKIRQNQIKYSDYRIYHWTREDIADKDEIEKIKSSVDEQAYKQEYLGEFVSYQGRIYSYYDVDVHIDFDNRLIPNLDLGIFLMLDFNKDCVYEMGQRLLDDRLYIFDEIYKKDTDIIQMNNEIKIRIINLCNGDEQKARTIELTFFGDYTQSSRRDVSVPTITGSGWRQIERAFEGWNFTRKTKKNPFVIDRVRSMQSMLYHNKLIHSPKCIELKKDFMQMAYEKIDKERSHGSDAVGYCTHYLWPAEII